MKYTLKKKFHPNQVEEIGHVFESIRTICYSITIDENREHTYQIPPHEIALLIHAGFLEIYDELFFSNEPTPFGSKESPAHKLKITEKIEFKKGVLPNLEESVVFTEEQMKAIDKFYVRRSESPEQKIDLWEEELKQRQEYWLVRDNGYVDSVLWLNDEYDIFRLKTKNCHRTKQSAEEALRQIKENHNIES